MMDRNPFRTIRFTAAALLASLCVVDVSVAGETGAPAKPSAASQSVDLTRPAQGDWKLSLEPYVWVAGLDGRVGIGGFDPVTIDVPFQDVVRHLKMAAMMQAEVHRDRWSLLLDGMYLNLAESVAGRNRLLDGIDIQVEQVLAEVALAYRLWEGERGYLDVLAGARYLNLRSELNFDINPSGVRAISEDISDGIVNAAFSSVQRAVDAAASRLSARIAALDVQGKKDAIRSDVRQAAIDKILETNTIGEIVGAIRSLTPEQIAEIRRRVGSAKELLAAERQLVAAVVEQKIARTVNEAKGRAARAVAKARKKLAEKIERTILGAIPDSVAASKGWVDPFIGFRGRFNFTDHLYLAARGDIGGFGVGSRLAWQAFGALGWQFSRNWSAELGYRYLSVDYEDGGFVYDTNTSGAFLGVRYTF